MPTFYLRGAVEMFNIRLELVVVGLYKFSKGTKQNARKASLVAFRAFAVQEPQGLDYRLTHCFVDVCIFHIQTMQYGDFVHRFPRGREKTVTLAQDALRNQTP